MVNPQEFRLGNYLLYQGELTQVTAISNVCIYVDACSSPVPCDSDDIQPVLLNDFLLGQLLSKNPRASRGWFIEGRNAFWQIEGEADQNGYSIIVCPSGKPIHITPGKIYAYHHLQNAYYALFRKEIMSDVKTLQTALNTARMLGKY